MKLLMKRTMTFACVFCAIALMPEMALANADVLISPLQKTLTMVSKTGAVIGGLAVAAAGIAYVFNKDDLSGWVSTLSRIAIGCALVAGATFVSSLFVG
ncbi:TrbC/VirB2 family protein [Desulfovibrio sp. OttesenSCG-928-F07]|nr:TrbC/VirB2 family protein [Desulfovibrio sp. OttesenSCG-928-F07]